jgi:hypothetical protein
MMEPAESLMSKDATEGYGTRPVVRRSLLESEMRAVVMIAAGIISQQTPHMTFIHRNLCGPAGLVGSFRPNAPQFHSAKDSATKCGHT